MPLNKKKLYEKEQQEILIKLMNIIGIKKDNVNIEKSYIESEDVSIQINNLKDDVVKYFSTSKWCSVKLGSNIEINIVRNIFKYFNIEVISIEKKRKDESNKYRSYRIYKFIIPESILNDL